MYAPSNLKLVTAEVPFQDTFIICSLEDVSYLYMEDVEGTETDLVMSVAVMKLVGYQVREIYLC